MRNRILKQNLRKESVESSPNINHLTTLILSFRGNLTNNLFEMFKLEFEYKFAWKKIILMIQLIFSAHILAVIKSNPQIPISIGNK